MILAAETYIACKYMGEENALRLMKEAGFDSVDFSFFYDACEVYLNDNYQELAKRTKEYLKVYGLQCRQAHAPFDFRYGNRMEESDLVYQYVLRSIEYASMIGAKQIVVHGVKVPEGEDFFSYNERYYKSLEPYAKRYGIKIAVENLITSSCRRPDLMEEMLSRLDSDQFVVCLDLGHAQLAEGTTPAEFIRQIRSGKLQALHIHDNDGIQDEHLLPYLGTLDWDAILDSLAEVGYEGDFTLEIGKFFEKYAPELLLNAMYFAVETARFMIGKLETKKQEQARAVI